MLRVWVESDDQLRARLTDDRDFDSYAGSREAILQAVDRWLGDFHTCA